eukprot:g2603.t1
MPSSTNPYVVNVRRFANEEERRATISSDVVERIKAQAVKPRGLIKATFDGAVYVQTVYDDDNTRLAFRSNNREERSKATGQSIIVGAPMKNFKFTDADIDPNFKFMSVINITATSPAAADLVAYRMNANLSAGGSREGLVSAAMMRPSAASIVFLGLWASEAAMRAGSTMKSTKKPDFDELILEQRTQFSTDAQFARL